MGSVDTEFYDISKICALQFRLTLSMCSGRANLGVNLTGDRGEHMCVMCSSSTICPLMRGKFSLSLDQEREARRGERRLCHSYSVCFSRYDVALRLSKQS